MEPLTLNDLPDVATPVDVARVMQTTTNALAQDRFLKRGLPYIKYGSRVRYLKADILVYLAAAQEQAKLNDEKASAAPIEAPEKTFVAPLRSTSRPTKESKANA